MGRFLGSGVYPLAKALERACVYVGYGEFGVLDGYKCIECHNDPSLPECLECRTAWTREVGFIDYSDACERRANIIMGSFCVTMAASSWLLNNALDWWEFGPFLASINAVLAVYMPDLATLPPVMRGIYLAVLCYIWAVSVLAVLAGFCISGFMMGMNPTSKRPYKHITPGAIVMLLIMTVVYVFVLIQRVYVVDILMIVVPAFTGVISLLFVPCMKKEVGKEVGEEDTGKLV